MAPDIDYLSHLTRESARFTEVLRDTPADARVPTCPDWDADDLIWHLGEVHWFWSTIVRDAVDDPEPLVEPDRPADRAGLLQFLESHTEELRRTLAETPSDAPRWSWSEEQTAGFTKRRQAHEALIHRVDAELTAGVERTPMDPELCTDGVDEGLRIMFAGVPEWGQVEPDPTATLRVRATDTGASWHVTLGRFTGTDPDGDPHDEPDIVVADADSGAPTAATVEGAVADLDCWIYGRPTVGALDRSGDPDVLRTFQQILDQGVQ